MASIYLGYDTEVGDLAQALQSALSAKGHKVRLDRELFAAGDWLENLSAALKQTDVFVPLISKDSSIFLQKQIGLAVP